MFLLLFLACSENKISSGEARPIATPSAVDFGEVNVGDQRNRHRGFDLGKCGCRLVIRDGNTDDFTPCIFQLADLGHRGLHIACIRRAHRLD